MKLEEYEKLLIVVDMVNGFVKEGAMADATIQKIIPTIKKLLELAKQKEIATCFIQDSHKKGCAEFEKFPEHCIEDTWESAVVLELLPYIVGSNIYKKNSTSTIWAPNFMDDIKKMKKLREVIITGCCTDICVMNLAIPLQNYFDQIDRKTKIIIPKNAVETFELPTHSREEYNQKAFDLMSQAGIQIVKKYGGR